MAIRKSKKTRVRCVGDRRVKQVQRLNDAEIQTLETISTHLLAALDTYRNSGTKRIIRSLRAALPAGFGTLIGTIHYALQERILQSRLHGVQLATETRSVSANRGKNKSVNPSTKRGGLFKDARFGLPNDFSVTPSYRDENISGDGERLYNFDARQPYTGSQRSGSQRKVPTDSERCDLYDPSGMGRCTRCED